MPEGRSGLGGASTGTRLGVTGRSGHASARAVEEADDDKRRVPKLRMFGLKTLGRYIAAMVLVFVLAMAWWLPPRLVGNGAGGLLGVYEGTEPGLLTLLLLSLLALKMAGVRRGVACESAEESG